MFCDLFESRGPDTKGARLVVLGVGLEDHPIPGRGKTFLATSTIVSSTVSVQRRKSICAAQRDQLSAGRSRSSWRLSADEVWGSRQSAGRTHLGEGSGASHEDLGQFDVGRGLVKIISCHNRATGQVEIDMPRDRNGSFQLVVVKKRERRLTALHTWGGGSSPPPMTSILSR